MKASVNFEDKCCMQHACTLNASIYFSGTKNAWQLKVSISKHFLLALVNKAFRSTGQNNQKHNRKKKHPHAEHRQVNCYKLFPRSKILLCAVT